MKKIVNKLAIVMAMLALLLITGVVASATDQSPANLVIENIDGEMVKLECQDTMDNMEWVSVENGQVAYVAYSEGRLAGEEAQRPAATGYYIILKPAAGYMTASAYVKTANGNVQLSAGEVPNIFPYSIQEEAVTGEEAEEAADTLVVSFRRARIELNVEQVSLKPGETMTPSGTISYTDGETYTRSFVKFPQIEYVSTNPDVADFNEQGELVAALTGFTRIEARPLYSNWDDVMAYFYVIVEEGNEKSVGTIQINSMFNEKAFFTDAEMGTSFLSLQYDDENSTSYAFSTESFKDVYVPTEKDAIPPEPGTDDDPEMPEDYYDAVERFTGEGEDPVTFYYATKGEEATEENEEIRKELADVLFEKSDDDFFTIKPGDVVTFGNYGEVDAGTILGILLTSDFGEAVERAGKSWQLEKLVANLLEGRLDLDGFWNVLKALGKEVLYDFEHGYNPFNYAVYGGGININYELYKQALDTDYSEAVGLRTGITEIQLDALIDYLQFNNSYEPLTNNSADVAVGGWNLVNADTKDNILENSILSATECITIPAFVKYNILLASSSLGYSDDVTCYGSIGVVKAEAYVKEGLINGKTIQPLFGDFKSNLMFQIISLEPGEVYATNKYGEWSSTDPLTVYVNQQGYMKAWQTGFAFVTCTGDLSFFAYLVLVR